MELDLGPGRAGRGGDRGGPAGGIDDVPGERRQLFGWAVREGVTNVVRHSGASRCRSGPRMRWRSPTTGAGRPGRPRRGPGRRLRRLQRTTEAGAAACCPRRRAGSCCGWAGPRRGPGRARRRRERDRDPGDPGSLLLADDQALVRGAMAALLALEPDLEVVAEVGRGDEVVAEARRAPDVALLDVEMPGLDGIGATGAPRGAAVVPGAGRDHVRPARLPAPRHGRRGQRVRGQGHPGPAAGRRGPPGRLRAPGGRPQPGLGDARRR